MINMFEKASNKFWRDGIVDWSSVYPGYGRVYQSCQIDLISLQCFTQWELCITFVQVIFQDISSAELSHDILNEFTFISSLSLTNLYSSTSSGTSKNYVLICTTKTLQLRVTFYQNFPIVSFYETTAYCEVCLYVLIILWPNRFLVNKIFTLSTLMLVDRS